MKSRWWWVFEVVWDQDRGQNNGKVGIGKMRSKSKNKKIVECCSCKHIGHWKRECPNRKHGSYSFVSVIQTYDSGNEANILCVSFSKCTNAWIPDSNYSYHVTSHSKWFTTFKSGNLGFYMGDDKAWNITWMWQIKISMDIGGMQTLNDVRYIFELVNNMISLGTLANGFSYKSDGDMDIMKVSNGAFIVMR